MSTIPPLAIRNQAHYAPDTLTEAKKALTEMRESFLPTLLPHLEAQSNSPIHDLPSLIKISEIHEFISELEKLETLFKEIFDVCNRFQTLCAAREGQNRNTALSFSALPDGACNKLYYKLAFILFNPQTPEELLSVLLPSIKNALTIHAEASSKHKEGLVIKGIQIAPLSSAFWKGSNSEFFIKECVIHEDALFNMTQIASWPITAHIEFYHSLTDESLRKKIYSHNDAMKELERDIQIFTQSFAPLGETLNKMVEAFKAGNKFFTSNPESASYAADLAGEAFRLYIASYPDNSRAVVLSLKSTDTSINLGRIHEGLLKKECIDTLTHWIQGVLGNPENKIYLGLKPNTSPEKEKEIKNKYKKTLEIDGVEKSFQLPTQGIKSVLENIHITSPENFQSLLINIPTEYYSIFLKDVVFTYKIETSIIGIFESLSLPEKQTALLLALFANYDKMYDAINTLLLFYLKNNQAIAKQMLSSVPEQQLMTFFKHRDAQFIRRVLVERRQGCSWRILDNLPETILPKFCIISSPSQHSYLATLISELDPKGSNQTLKDLIAKTPLSNREFYETLYQIYIKADYVYRSPLLFSILPREKQEWLFIQIFKGEKESDKAKIAILKILLKEGVNTFCDFFNLLGERTKNEFLTKLFDPQGDQSNLELILEILKLDPTEINRLLSLVEKELLQNFFSAKSAEIFSRVMAIESIETIDKIHALLVEKNQAALFYTPLGLIKCIERKKGDFPHYQTDTETFKHITEKYLKSIPSDTLEILLTEEVAKSEDPKNSLIHECARNKQLKTIFTLLPKEKILSFFELKNYCGATILHVGSQFSTEALELAVNHLADANLTKVLTAVDNRGRNFFHYGIEIFGMRSWFSKFKNLSPIDLSETPDLNGRTPSHEVSDIHNAYF